jgi:hypothetical protein
MKFKVTIDISGQRFHRYIVLRQHGSKNGHATFECQCDCGIVKIVKGTKLRNGTTKSCGCKRKDGNHRTHGMNRTKEHAAWIGIVQRTTNTKSLAWNNYGGRGIDIDPSWLKFEQFFEDMGFAPSPAHSVERIENDGEYRKENCRWGTSEEQSRNKRSNHKITYNGKTMILTDWALSVGVKRRVLSDRINKLKWPIERALNEPARTQRKTRTASARR